MDREHHPVWQVYDEFRSSRLTAYCLRESVGRWKLINGIFEAIVVVGTASSIGGLSFLKTGVGADIWTVVGVLAILLKVLKPVFGIHATIERREKLATQFEERGDELRVLEQRINTRQAYNQTSKREFFAIVNRWKGKIHDQNGDLHASAAFKKKCQARVELEFPGNRFYVPEVYETD